MMLVVSADHPDEQGAIDDDSLGRSPIPTGNAFGSAEISGQTITTHRSDQIDGEIVERRCPASRPVRPRFEPAPHDVELGKPRRAGDSASIALASSSGKRTVRFFVRGV